MSNNYHSAITTGAAANAATINTPLGLIDAALKEVDDRVDNIIADSGTSSTEVVDARFSYTVLRDKIDDLALRSNVLLVDAAFTTNASERRFETISAAMTAAAAGATIIVAPGTYTENVTFSQNDIKLIGSGAAGYNSGSSAWGVGTIVVGKINLNAKVRCTVSDLSVDVRASVLDGIVSATSPATSPLCLATIRNVVIAGNGLYAAAHGILLHSGGGNRVENVTAYTIGHAVALRCGYTVVDGVYADSCGSSTVIVKSAASSGDAHFVNISNVTAISSQGISIESTDASYSTLYININNAVGLSTLLTLVSVGVTAGSVQHVNVSNCHSSANSSGTYGAFNVQAGTDITFTNCQSNYASCYGFRNVSGLRVRLVGCAVQNPTTAVTNGSFAQLNVNGIAITGAIAQRTTSQSIPNTTWTAVTGMTGLTDVSGLVATDYITVPTNGIYRLRARATWASNSTGNRHICFYVVGVGQYGATQTAALTTQMDSAVEWIMQLTAGQGVQCQLYQSSGGALNALAVQYEMQLLQGT